MSMTRIDDISYELDGDYVDLEQDVGCGEVDRVRLHRIHLAHLAERAGLLSADQAADPSISTLQRRLRTLTREIRGVADWVRSDPDEDEASFPVFLQIMALDTLAQALTDDLPAANDAHQRQGQSEAVPKTESLNSPEIGSVAAGAVPKTGPHEVQLDLLESHGGMA